MNSSQINFFAGPHETALIYNYFKNNGCSFIKRVINSEKDKEDYNLELQEGELYQVYIYNSNLNKNILFTHLEESNSSAVDVLKSNCIEFGIGGLYPSNNRELNRSRFYYVTKYFNEKGLLQSKDPEFIKWAKHILGNFKREFLLKCNQVNGIYCTIEAINWINSNRAQIAFGGQKFKF